MAKDEAAGGASVLPSIRDVALRAGVSPATVSNVLNGRRSREDSIATAVLAAVEELGYRRNAIASNLRRAHSRIVGVVIPDFAESRSNRLVAALERHVSAAGYRMVAVSSHDAAEAEIDEIEDLLSWRVAGLLVVPAGASDIGRIAQRAQGVPVVVLDRLMENAGVDCVGVDGPRSAAQALERLAMRTPGEIIVFHGDMQSETLALRLAGTRSSPHGARLRFLSHQGTFEQARTVLATIGDGDAGVTNMLALDGPATLAAFDRAMQHRTRMALSAFDPLDFMAPLRPDLEFIAHPLEAIAEAAWSRLVARMLGDGRPHAALQLDCLVSACDGAPRKGG